MWGALRLWKPVAALQLAVASTSPASVSPDHLDSIVTHLGIGTDESEAADFGLRDEQAVEGVAVLHGQRAHPVGVAGGDRQRSTPARSNRASRSAGACRVTCPHGRVLGRSRRRPNFGNGCTFHGLAFYG